MCSARTGRGAGPHAPEQDGAAAHLGEAHLRVPAWWRTSGERGRGGMLARACAGGAPAGAAPMLCSPPSRIVASSHHPRAIVFAWCPPERAHDDGGGRGVTAGLGDDTRIHRGSARRKAGAEVVCFVRATDLPIMTHVGEWAGACVRPVLDAQQVAVSGSPCPSAPAAPPAALQAPLCAAAQRAALGSPRRSPPSMGPERRWSHLQAHRAVAGASV